MPITKTAPFKIESVNADEGHITVRYINPYGPIESGEVIYAELVKIIEIPTGDYNEDGTPVVRLETIYPDNPNEDLIYNVDAPVVNGAFMTGEALLEHIAKSYPFDIFETMKSRKQAQIPVELNGIAGKEYQINLIYPDPVDIPLTVEDAKKMRTSYVEVSRIQSMAGLSVIWDGDEWNASEEILTRITNVMLTLQDANTRGRPIPPSIPWLTYGDTPRLLTLDDLSALRIAILEAQNVLWTKNSTLKEQIKAATTMEEVAAIIW